MDYTATVQNYLANGFNVLPLQVDGSKKPIGSWSHLQDRQLSEHEIQTYWSNGKPAGIGILAGPSSGNLHIIDFDAEAEVYFQRFWGSLLAFNPGLVNRILVVATPRPGRQVWFRQASTPPKSQQLAMTEPQPTGAVDADGNEIQLPAVLIETRGRGGYAVAVGGPDGVHPTGEPYQLIHGDYSQLPIITDEEATGLLDICRSYTRYTPEHVQRQPGERYTGEPRPGDVFNQHADIRQLLLDAGWEIHHEDPDGVLYLTRPGKAVSDGYSATLGYIRDDEDRPLLRVHTSAAPPFEPACYDAFACYALLKHSGDFGQAAAAVKIEYAAQVNAAQAEFHARVKEQFSQAQPAADYTPFPLECLDPVSAAYVRQHASAKDIDTAYVAVPLLSVLAGLIGPSRRIQLLESWSEPSIIWTVTIGRPSSGKSPGWKAADDLAENIQHSLYLADKQRKEADPENSTPPHQLLVNDITTESLAKVHQHNDRLILSCEELAAWVKTQDQYRKGSDEQKWIALHGGGSLRVNRATNDSYIYVPRTSVSVTGTIQPGVAAETLFSKQARASGFAYRILAVQPPRHIMGRPTGKLETATTQAMQHLAQQLYQLEQERCGESCRPFLLTCTHEAEELFWEFHDKVGQLALEADPDSESRWVKLRAVAARIALVLSCTKQLLEHPQGQARQPVDADSMQAGVRLAEWFGHEMERNWLAVSGEDDGLSQHYSWIISRHPQGVDARTLQQGRWSIRTADEARQVIQHLVHIGAGRWVNNLFVPMN